MNTSTDNAQRWRRAGPVTLRSGLLVASWIAHLRYGESPRIAGADNPTFRLNDFDRLSRALQDRAAAVRACMNRGVGDLRVMRDELSHDVTTGLQALALIAEHEDQPFLRKQMDQMLESLSGLARRSAMSCAA